MFLKDKDLKNKQKTHAVSEMVQQITELAAKPANLSLIPRIHMDEGENQVPQIALHTCSCRYNIKKSLSHIEGI